MELAKKAIVYDDVIDELLVKIHNVLIDLMAKGGNEEVYIDLLIIAKYLERVGEYATNIAEWV